MKNLSSTAFLLLFFAFGLFAQAPQTIPYQGVARDSTGTPIASQRMNARFSIYNANATGTLLYQEQDSFTTTSLGLFSINIGSSSTGVSGSFTSINWADSAKFLRVELDPTGGTSFVSMGASQLMSVPYALYSGGSSKISGRAGSVSYYGSTGIGTADPYFARNDTNFNTILFTAHGAITEGLMLGGQPSIFGDGAYMLRQDTTAHHIDIVGEFFGPNLLSPSFDSAHEIGIFCLNEISAAGAAIYLVDSNPVNPQAMVVAGNGGNYQGISEYTTDTTFTGLWNNATNTYTGIFTDTNQIHILSKNYSWSWPVSDAATPGEVLSTNGSGTLGWTNPASVIPTAHWCSVYSDTAQSAASATWTPVNFRKSNYDTDGYHSNTTNNSRITIPTGLGGLYMVTANVDFTLTDGSYSIGVKFLVNGSSDIYGYTYTTKAYADNGSVPYTALIHLNAGDYVETEMFQASGSTITTGPGYHGAPLFSATLIGQ